MRIQVLEGWKERRHDGRAELHWKAKGKIGPLNGWEEYQRDWNFIETDYSDRPSNNGLGLGNPGFAFHTKLARHLVEKDIAP